MKTILSSQSTHKQMSRPDLTQEGMKTGDPTSTCQARLNPVMAVVTVRDGVKNSLGSQTLEARSSSLGWGLYSKSKWCDLKEKRDMVWFVVLKNYFGSCVVILTVSSTFLDKSVSRKPNAVLLIKDSGVNHLPIRSSMDLLISLWTSITEAFFL